MLFVLLDSRESLYQLPVLRVRGDKTGALRHLKVGEIKAGRYSTTDQSISIRPFQTRAEPMPCGYYMLKLFSLLRVIAQFCHYMVAMEIDAMDEQCRPGVEVPDLISSQAVEGRKLVRSEQKVNCSRGAAWPLKARWQS